MSKAATETKKKDRKAMAPTRDPTVLRRTNASKTIAATIANSSSSSRSSTSSRCSSISCRKGHTYMHSSLPPAFSPSPCVGGVPSELLCRRDVCHESDPTSPPLREKTQTPTVVEKCSRDCDTVPRSGSSSCLISEPANQNIPQCKQPAISGEFLENVSVSLSTQVKKSSSSRNCGTAVPGCDKSVTVEKRTTQRDWARSLQLCLLETKTELHEARTAAETYQQKALEASMEIKRLYGLVSSQKQRIAELEQKITQAQTFSGTDGNQTNGVVTDVLESLDGLSVSAIKAAVHGAVEALRRIEAQLNVEKRRRRALEKENDTLRAQLIFSGEVKEEKENRYNKRPTHCCDEVHNCAMAFLQGPLQRFLAESAELRDLLRDPSPGRMHM